MLSSQEDVWPSLEFPEPRDGGGAGERVNGTHFPKEHPTRSSHSGHSGSAKQPPRAAAAVSQLPPPHSRPHLTGLARQIFVLQKSKHGRSDPVLQEPVVWKGWHRGRSHFPLWVRVTADLARSPVLWDQQPGLGKSLLARRKWENPREWTAGTGCERSKGQRRVGRLDSAACQFRKDSASCQGEPPQADQCKRKSPRPL